MTQKQTQPQQQEENNVISGVFCYAKITTPVPNFDKTGKEFAIDVVVDKATFKAFGKRFQKQKGKTVDTEQFEDIYKIPAPFPDQDEQYVLKLGRKAQYKDGTPLPEASYPKILVKQDSKTAKPLGKDVLIANGSKGKVSFTVVENDYGSFASLKAVLVEKLIEYKKENADVASDFGLETEFDEVEEAKDFEDGTSSKTSDTDSEDDHSPF